MESDVEERRPGRRVGSAVGYYIRRLKVAQCESSWLEMKNTLGIHQVVFIRMLYFLGSNGSVPPLP